MSVRSFFDSNVLVYTDAVQVLQEYYRVTTAKLAVDPAVAIEKLMLFSRADVVQAGSADVIAAAR